MTRPQVINGLQTSETIFKTLQTDAEDDRVVMLKVLETSDSELRTRITKSTNYQSSFSTAGLRSGDRVHINIENYFQSHGLDYVRKMSARTQYEPVSQNSVSVTFLGSCVRGIALRMGMSQAQQKTKWLRSDTEYEQVFSDDMPLSVYRYCVEIVMLVEKTLRASGVKIGKPRRGRVSGVSFGVSRYLTSLTTGKLQYDPLDLKDLVASKIKPSSITDAYESIRNFSAVTNDDSKMPLLQVLGFTTEKIDGAINVALLSGSAQEC